VSVITHVRSISEELYGKLRERPDIATRLAAERQAIDFERTAFIAEHLRGVPPETKAKVSEWANQRADALVGEHAAVWETLTKDGVQRSDVDVALEVGRVGFGLGLAFARTKVTIFEAGEEVGDDVGYGPTRMFSPSETHALYAAMVALPIATFATQYEAASRGDTTSDPYEGFEMVVSARVKLGAYLHRAKVSFRALLVWSD